MQLEATVNKAVTAKPPDSKINSIQVLRGVAALIVAVYHLKDLAKNNPPFKQILDFFFNNGAAGVNLFFVISGFIMVYITPQDKYSISDIYQFLVKRILRIWPTYVVITLLYVIVVFGSDFYLQASRIIDSLLFIPLDSTDPPFYGFSVISVGWSLNYEIYFYIIIAFSMLFSQFRWIVFFLIIAVTLIVIPMSYGSFTFEPEKEYDYGNRYLNMVTNPMMWNFVYGIIFGMLYRYPKALKLLSDLFSRKWLFYFFILLAVWQYFSGFLGGFGPFRWGLGTSALFLAFLFHNAGKTIQFPPWLVHLGNISFSIYLLHLPVHRIVERVFSKLNYPIYSTGLAALFLIMGLTIILSSLSHKYLEVRFSNFIKNLLVKSTKRNDRLSI